jgi:hypothetical protein
MIVVLIWRPGGVVGGQEVTWPIWKKRVKPQVTKEVEDVA